MGYTTDFSGRFDTNKPLTDKMFDFLKKFNETRRMGRNVDAAFGVEGEFYIFGGGDYGQGSEANIIDHNTPPRTQPGLWCQWTPSDDRMGIEWDCGEKFYHYTEWLVYLIHKILAPNGYVLNGTVTWQGEETGDVGEIIVENNRVYSQPWKDSKREVTPQNAMCYSYPKGNVSNFMETDIVLILDGENILLEEPKKEHSVEVVVTNESKSFAKWMVIHTQEVLHTQAPCRRYKNKVYTVDELYDIFLAL